MAETLVMATAAATGGTALPWLSTAGQIGSMVGNVGVGSLISGGLTAASAFGSIMGGQQQSAVYKAQAAQYELSAKQEELRGREQADKIRRSLQATLASQNAAFGARGISTRSGTPVSLARGSMTEAGYDINLAQFGAGQSSAALRSQAGQSRVSASVAKTSGYTSAATSIYKYGSLL